MTNKLRHASSPYLLQHAENPVEWYPWGKEALSKAVTEDKPIFLSIGYAACHWCHVMAHESFEDAVTAGIMNDHFISIKVDREERPDLDSIYMDAVVAMTGQGGWPMSVFLTPEGQPFFGGTYFPPTPRHGMPSFNQVLMSVAHAWKADRERLEASSADLTNRIRHTLALSESGEDLREAALDRAVEGLLQSYDWSNGGWGSAPKFPQPMAIEFLLQRAAVQGDGQARDMAKHALHSMASGGIFDHLGGGFARYSVDRQWIVPHFEKMLYDNAQLIGTYLHGWQVTGDSDLLEVSRRTVEFCLRELRLPEGGFASSLDADSDGGEGSFYVWDEEDLREAIPAPELWRVFAHAYGIDGPPNFEGQWVLRRNADDAELSELFSLTRETISDQLRRGRDLALSSRNRRARPAMDDKVLAAWNGLMLCSLAKFARATGDRDATNACRDLGRFLRDHLLDGARPFRAWRAGQASQPGFLEDSAALGLGWLALYELDFEPGWFELAKAQAEVILENFSDDDGGFFDTPADQAERLVVRPKSIQDNPTPSGNTMAVQLFLRLAAVTGDTRRYAEPALRSLRAIQPIAAQHPMAFAGWLGALGFAVGPQSQLAFVGFEPEAAYRRLRSAADRRFLPYTVMAGRDASETADLTLLEGRTSLEGQPTAYLCRDFTCKRPTTDPDTLSLQLEAGESA